MAERYDVGVVGSGAAAYVAAAKLASAGKKVVLFKRGDVAAETNDPVGLYYSESLSSLGGELPDGLLKVVDDRVYMLGSGSGTVSSLRADGRDEQPVALVGERKSVNAWLLERATAAGVSVVDASSGSLEKRFDRGDQLQAVALGEDVYRLRALVIGEGGECCADADLTQPETVTRKVITATQSFTLDASKLAERFGLESGQASAGAILGAAPKGMAGRAWLYTTEGGLTLGMSCVVSVFDEQAEEKIKAAMSAMAESACIKLALKDAQAGEITTAQGDITGFKYINQLCGNGWLLVGPTTRLIDPLRHEASHHEITQGHFAADAVLRSLAIDDTGARPLSVYEHMLGDSYVMKNLKAQKNAVEDIERDPSLVSFYSEFVNRWFAHDTAAGLDNRRERNKAFFKNLKNERPVWEFAMGMRKSLKLLRD